MQNQYPTVLKRKPKQPAVKQGDGEEELPFNRKTAIFFYCCQGFGKTTTTKLLLRCLVIPLKFVVVKISSKKWQEDPDVGKFAKPLTGVIAGAANPWLLARTSEQSQIHPEFTFFFSGSMSIKCQGWGVLGSVIFRVSLGEYTVLV